VAPRKPRERRIRKLKKIIFGIWVAFTIIMIIVSIEIYRAITLALPADIPKITFLFIPIIGSIPCAVTVICWSLIGKK